MSRKPRLAVRGLVLNEGRLLMVNAFPGNTSDLLCAPGGGVEVGQSLPCNLKRELFEETGLGVEVGQIALVNEFQDPPRGFHQVDIYFRCTMISGDPNANWVDPEGVVNRRFWLTREDLEKHRYKPDSLPDVAWGDSDICAYDPLELILR
ncbi:NUDIX domain-containing protein [Rhodobacteraceae bacterium]|nr:NUDIX domain-containing protein [Paracoccaceae bacterium]